MNLPLRLLFIPVDREGESSSIMLTINILELAAKNSNIISYGSTTLTPGQTISGSRIITNDGGYRYIQFTVNALANAKVGFVMTGGLSILLKKTDTRISIKRIGDYTPPA